MRTNIYIICAIMAAIGIGACQEDFYGYPNKYTALNPNDFEIQSNFENGVLEVPEVLFDWEIPDFYNYYYEYEDLEVIVTIVPEDIPQVYSKSPSNFINGKFEFTTKLGNGYLAIPARELVFDDCLPAARYSYSFQLKDVVDTYDCARSKGTFSIADNIDFNYSSDRETLIKIYNSTGGDNWNHNYNWCSDEPLGWWDGVVTDGYGHVTELNLSNFNLTGSISDVNLPFLKYLNLSDNNLEYLQMEAPRLSYVSLYHAFTREKATGINLNVPYMPLDIDGNPTLTDIRGTYGQLYIHDLNIEILENRDSKGISIDVDTNALLVYNAVGLQTVKCPGLIYLDGCRRSDSTATLDIETSDNLTLQKVMDYKEIVADALRLYVENSEIGILAPKNVEWFRVTDSNIGVVRHSGLLTDCFVFIENTRLHTIDEGDENSIYVLSSSFYYTPENWVKYLSQYL